MPGETIVGYDELLTGDYPAPVPIIDGLIEAGTVANWSALWGTGKTWLALAAARAVASGTSFFCHFPTRKGRVLIIDQESTPGGIQSRLRALAAAHPLGDGLDITFAFLHGVRLDDLEGFKRLDALLSQHVPDLVIFDSWVRIMAANENNAVAVALVNENIRSLVLRYGCAAVILDHIRKRPAGGGSDDPSDRTRGSGEKIGFVENALTIERCRDDSDELIVHPLKRRYGELLLPFRVAFDHDPDIGSVALRYRGEAQPGDVFGGPGLIAEAIPALKAQWGDDAADVLTIAGWLEWSPSKVRRVLKGMVTTGLVCERKVRPVSCKGTNRNVYDLVESR